MFLFFRGNNIMNKLAIIAGAALLSASAVGLAGEYTPPAPMGLGDYAYIGLEGGASQMFLSHSRFSSDIEKKNDGWGISGRIFGGYLWKAAENFYAGLELGFSLYDGIDFKKNTAPVGKIDVTGYNLDLMAVGKYNFTDNFNAFLKAGVAYVWQKFDFSGDLTLRDIGITESSHADDVNDNVRDGNFRPKATFGLGYDFNNNFGMTLSYSYIFGTDKPKNTDDVISVGSLYLGVIYRFV